MPLRKVRTLSFARLKLSVLVSGFKQQLLKHLAIENEEQIFDEIERIKTDLTGISYLISPFYSIYIFLQKNSKIRPVH
jgi:hypothetical protein